MSLWTPYSTEEVLDLSAKAATIKAESGTRHREPSVAASAGCWEPRLPMHVMPPLPHTLVPPPYPSPDTSLYSDQCCSSPQLSPAWSTGSKSPTERSQRPFKVVAPSLPVGDDCSVTSDSDFLSFRENMLSIMRARNGGNQCVSNPRMRRSVHRSNDSPNAEYLERRERNNAAAKRSRDLRKMREDELAIRAAYLERCNERLKAQLEAANAELTILRARF